MHIVRVYRSHKDTQEPGVRAEERAATEPGKEKRPWRKPP